MIIRLITGPSGSGKSWVCKHLKDVYHVDFDRVVRSVEKLKDVFDNVQAQKLPVVADLTKLVSTMMNRNPQFEWKLYVVDETLDVIKDRLVSRGGNYNEKAIITRKKRLGNILTRVGGVTGTAVEILNHIALELGQVPEFPIETTAREVCSGGKGTRTWNYTPEVRECLSRARRGVSRGPFTEAHKQALSDAAQLRSSDPSWRNEHSARLRGRSISNTHRAAIKAGMAKSEKTGRPKGWVINADEAEILGFAKDGLTELTDVQKKILRRYRYKQEKLNEKEA